MSDRLRAVAERERMAVVAIERQRRPEPIRSHAHAAQVLSDEAFLAYARVEAEKVYQALVRKRWPQVR